MFTKSSLHKGWVLAIIKSYIISKHNAAAPTTMILFSLMFISLSWFPNILVTEKVGGFIPVAIYTVHTDGE
jgi:hypothetical protein